MTWRAGLYRRRFHGRPARPSPRMADLPSGLLPDGHVRMVATLFDGDWTTEAALLAVLT